jgi:dTDP-4-amino-4,6-dideoxygalactose transaminase
VHVFGHPVEIEEIVSVCDRYNLPVIEDAAESLGSTYNGRQTGTLGTLGVFSFNGNKTVTTGGGGMIVTYNEELAKRAKHITTTAKKPHRWEYNHDETAFNYRLPNVNAALGCAQLELLPDFVREKRDIAKQYRSYFEDTAISFVTDTSGTCSNYWLNAVLLDDKEERDAFLSYTNDNNVMTRPLWKLMPHLPMYKDCERTDLSNAQWLEDRLVNIPSSVRTFSIKKQ